MAITTIKATIQMRHGAEDDFDADQMTAGEWAVSTDAKYVRMCFSPGIVRRMATYEAFEEDMKIIQQILATCQDIQVAVEAFERLAEQHKNAAAASATAAAGSAQAAKVSETNSELSEQAAKTSETAAADSAQAAKTSEVNSKDSETKAKASEIAAAGSAQAAADSASDALDASETAIQKADEASDYSALSKSYAVGTDDVVRPGDSQDNAKKYAEDAKKSADLAKETVGLNLPTFEVDMDTMHLLGTFDKIFDFALTDDGHLTVAVSS